MKLRNLFLMLFASIVVLSSCSNDDDSGDSDMDSIPNGTWQLGTFTYETAVSNQNTSQGNLVVIVASTDNDNSQGDASGSAITFAFYDNGEGAYQISEAGTIALNPEERLLEISCTIGTATVNSSRYDATELTSGDAIITETDGIYTVSIPSATLYKSIETGTGVPNTEDSYPFTANRIE